VVESQDLLLRKTQPSNWTLGVTIERILADLCWKTIRTIWRRVGFLATRESTSELAELGILSETKYVSSLGLALICVGIGDDARAFGHFEKAIQEHCDMMVSLNVDSRFDLIRSDLRFKNLISRVGLIN